MIRQRICVCVCVFVCVCLCLCVCVCVCVCCCHDDKNQLCLLLIFSYGWCARGDPDFATISNNSTTQWDNCSTEQSIEWLLQKWKIQTINTVVNQWVSEFIKKTWCMNVSVWISSLCCYFTYVDFLTLYLPLMMNVVNVHDFIKIVDYKWHFDQQQCFFYK